MISALHLIWIVPLSTMFGFVTCAIMSVGKQADGVFERNGDTKN